jgi:hypothetical protein
MNRTKTVSEDRKTRATGVDLSGVVMPETRIRPRRSTQLDPLTVVVFFAVLLSSHVTLAQTQTADYEVIFEATWSAATHPVQFPQSPHFSPPVGGTHNSNVIFWEPGGIATFGIELMAETGNTSGLSNEINAEIVAGFADQSFVANGINSPGTRSLNITVDQSFSELTLVSMLAPSPDWFVGVHGLPLFDQGWWVPEIVVDLFAYDAGTDDGTTYESANADSSPPLPISLQGFPLEVGVPVGTMTIRRLPEPDLSLQLLVSLTLLALLGHRRRSASPDGHLAPPDTRADQVTLDYTHPRAAGPILSIRSNHKLLMARKTKASNCCRSASSRASRPSSLAQKTQAASRSLPRIIATLLPASRVAIAVEADSRWLFCSIRLPFWPIWRARSEKAENHAEGAR